MDNGDDGRLGESARFVLREVLHAVRPPTKPELSRLTGLSKPTVGAAVVELQRQGLLEEQGRASGSVGRAPSLWGLSDRAGWVIGLDLGNTQLRLVAQSLGGVDLHRTELDVGFESDRAPAQAARLVATARRLLGPQYGPLRAIGASVPDVIHPNSELMPEQVQRIVRGLGERDVALLLDNNVNCAALAETRGGAGVGRSDLLYLQIGVALGAGAIIAGQLHRGANGAAGEIARIPFPLTVGESGRSVVALEDYVSASGLLARAETAWADASGTPPHDTGDLLRRAGEGDSKAMALVDDEAGVLAQLIATICAINDPELVVLGGGIGTDEEIVSRTGAALRALAFDVEVAAGQRGFGASAEGAASLALGAAVAELLGDSS